MWTASIPNGQSARGTERKIGDSRLGHCGSCDLKVPFAILRGPVLDNRPVQLSSEEFRPSTTVLLRLRRRPEESLRYQSDHLRSRTALSKVALIAMSEKAH